MLNVASVKKLETLLRNRDPLPWTHDVHLPNPATLIGSVPLEGRTYTLLRRRVDGTPVAGTWTVAQYLAIKGFGARALIDVLSALEAQIVVPPTALPSGPFDLPVIPAPPLAATLAAELEAIARWHRGRCNSRGPDRPSADDPRHRGTPLLDRALRLIGEALPLSTDAAVAVVRPLGGHDNSTSATDVSFDEIANAAVRLGRPTPFRRVRIGALDLLVRWNDVDAARHVHNIATRMAYDWGIPQIEAVAERLSVVTGHRRSNDFIERVLSAHPDFAWLDRTAGWFWFRGRHSRLHDGIAKIFSVATRVDLRTLGLLLFRNRPTPDRPSTLALRNALAALSQITVAGDLVTVPTPLDRQTHLSRVERDVVPLFERHGPVLTAQGLRRIGHWDPGTWSEIDRTLRTSPLFQEAPGAYRLVGK
jgi:hypothetical protein